MWNIKVTVGAIVIEALATVPKQLERTLQKLDILDLKLFKQQRYEIFLTQVNHQILREIGIISTPVKKK